MDDVKADKAELDKTNAQVSNNTTNITTNSNNITATNTKLDKEVARLDDVKADKATVNDRFIGLDATDDRLEAAIKDSNKNTTTQITALDQRQSVINNTQNQNISKNADDINKLGYRVDTLEKEMNAGIAQALAIAQMPSPSIPGRNMFTFASGYHNGESAIALGFSGSSDTGIASYKIGGSWSEVGGTSFAVGGGIMFD